MKKENLLGKIFDRLTVIAEAKNINKRAAWLCRCACGKEKIIKAEALKNKDTKSCGCLNEEKRKERSHDLYSSVIKYHPSKTSARRVWKKRYNDSDLSFDDFYKISQMNCYYCRDPPSNKQNAAIDDKKSSQYAKDNGDFIYNGLDRIDNNLPHTLNNVVACCKWCNYAKRERTLEEFKIWIKKLFNNLKD